MTEYAAYFRHLKHRLARTVQNAGNNKTYPESVPHCDVCQWFRECNSQRRGDDHLSLVAGIRKQQRNQLEEWDTRTMAKLAALPIPLKQKPKHGSREGLEHVREQARVQVAGRSEARLIHEPIVPVEAARGFCRLPEPSSDDIFFDIEGDPFVGNSGLQYLFGFAFNNLNGKLSYEKRWAFTPEDEKKGFEWLVDEIKRRREANPKMHVYHFGAHEPSTFKRLMGIYATRENEIDRMLRAGVLVDLHQAFKQAVRAGVEEYSLKKIEAFYQFARSTPLDQSRTAMRYIEHCLELDRSIDNLPSEFRQAMEGYNADDCFSAAKLRDWLEVERQKLFRDGMDVPRFVDRDEEASEELTERQERVSILVAELTSGIPSETKARTNEQQAQWLLAQLLDWHRRESKTKAWRYFELRDMDDELLLEQKDAISGLTWHGRVTSTGGVVADRYSFPDQETTIRADEKKEAHSEDRRIGTVVAIDPVERTVDIKKSSDAAGFHPTAIFLKEPIAKPWSNKTRYINSGVGSEITALTRPEPGAQRVICCCAGLPDSQLRKVRGQPC